MIGVREYIKQLGKEFIYSEVLFQESTINGAASQAFIDWKKQNAVLIIVHTINVSVPTVPGASATIKDQFNRTILFFNLDVSFSNQYLCEDVIDGGKLQIVCSDSRVKFTVGYQYLMLKGQR